VKTINVTFEDEEYQRLKKKKGKLSWHDFIMTLAKGGDGADKNA
jgi:predicted CopG family antitoxin